MPVVFDCDGVLVDTEPLAALAWGAWTGRHGYSVTEDDVLACTGLTEQDTYAYLCKRVNLPPWEETIAAVDQVRWPLLESEMQAFPDAVKTVRELAMNGVPLAVASSSRIASVRRKLDLVDLARFFDVFVGGDEVASGKPAPDVYLLAAGRLGVEPASCLAVEDAPAGVAAANAAGMRVVAVNREGQVLAGATTVSSLDAALLQLWL